MAGGKKQQDHDKEGLILFKKMQASLNIKIFPRTYRAYALIYAFTLCEEILLNTCANWSDEEKKFKRENYLGACNLIRKSREEKDLEDLKTIKPGSLARLLEPFIYFCKHEEALAFLDHSEQIKENAIRVCSKEE